eukprot:7434422-Pyramimonas_sp.AAC.3
MIKPCRYMALGMVQITIVSITAALLWILVELLFHSDVGNGSSGSSSDTLPCYIKVSGSPTFLTAASRVTSLHLVDPNITSATYTAGLDRIDLDIAKYPKAVCNDGSTGTYYYKRAIPNFGRDHIFNVHFQGGYWCTDAKQCRRRRSATAYHRKRISNGVRAIDALLDVPVLRHSLILNDMPAEGVWRGSRTSFPHAHMKLRTL